MADRKPSNLAHMRRQADAAAALMRALSNGARLRVLCDLVEGEKSAGALVESSGLSQSALSQHLARLRADGLVATRREGLNIFYRLDDPRAGQILSLLYSLYCKR